MGTIDSHRPFSCTGIRHWASKKKNRNSYKPSLYHNHQLATNNPPTATVNPVYISGNPTCHPLHLTLLASSLAYLTPFFPAGPINLSLSGTLGGHTAYLIGVQHANTVGTHVCDGHATALSISTHISCPSPAP